MDVQITEEKFDPTITDRLDALKEMLAVKNEMKIINTRISYNDKKAARFSTTFNTNELNDIKPLDVFKTLIEDRTDEEKVKLFEKFSEIIADTTQA